MSLIDRVRGFGLLKEHDVQYIYITMIPLAVSLASIPNYRKGSHQKRSVVKPLVRFRARTDFCLLEQTTRVLVDSAVEAACQACYAMRACEVHMVSSQYNSKHRLLSQEGSHVDLVCFHATLPVLKSLRSSLAAAAKGASDGSDATTAFQQGSALCRLCCQPV